MRARLVETMGVAAWRVGPVLLLRDLCPSYRHLKKINPNRNQKQGDGKEGDGDGEEEGYFLPVLHHGAHFLVIHKPAQLPIDTSSNPHRLPGSRARHGRGKRDEKDDDGEEEEDEEALERERERRKVSVRSLLEVAYPHYQLRNCHQLDCASK